MRVVALDTETTGFSRGLDPSLGHRIVEIACVEIIDGVVTGRYFHSYLNPQREISPGAMRIHGLTNAFLSKQPLFKDVSDSFLRFIGSDLVVIHNAPFDISFIDKEFLLLNERPVSTFHFIDTLLLSRSLFPGLPNGLDSLCRRFEIPERYTHSALGDATILAYIYLHLIKLL